MIDGDVELRRPMIRVDRTGGNPDLLCRHEIGLDQHEAEKPAGTPPSEGMKPSLAKHLASALKFISEPPEEVDPGRVIFEQGDSGSRSEKLNFPKTSS